MNSENIPIDKMDIRYILNSNHSTSSLGQYILEARNFITNTFNSQKQQSNQIKSPYQYHQEPNLSFIQSIPKRQTRSALSKQNKPVKTRIQHKKRKHASKEQVKALENVFKDFRYPSTAHKVQIAHDIQMTLQSVRVWFQNKRHLTIA